MLTDYLDALGLVLIALGVATLVATALAPGWGFLAAGAVVLTGSAIAALARRPVRKGDQ